MPLNFPVPPVSLITPQTPDALLLSVVIGNEASGVHR
jgi:hypothetical protein